MIYLSVTKTRDLAAHISDNLSTVVEFASIYKDTGVWCRSFCTKEDAYAYYTCLKANHTVRNNSNAIILPTMEMFNTNFIYEDENVRTTMPPWYITGERYFAVIAFNHTKALVEGVPNLSNCLLNLNGLHVVIDEFRYADDAQLWLVNNVQVPLLAMGAYIAPNTPIPIPEVGQQINGIDYRYIKAMPEIQDKILQIGINPSEREENHE